MKKDFPVTSLQVGDIVKINSNAIKSGFASSDYDEEMRFEILDIEDKQRPRHDLTRVITHLVGYNGDDIDVFPIYMLEKV